MYYVLYKMILGYVCTITVFTMYSIKCSQDMCVLLPIYVQFTVYNVPVISMYNYLPIYYVLYKMFLGYACTITYLCTMYSKNVARICVYYYQPWNYLLYNMFLGYVCTITYLCNMYSIKCS